MSCFLCPGKRGPKADMCPFNLTAKSALKQKAVTPKHMPVSVACSGSEYFDILPPLLNGRVTNCMKFPGMKKGV